MSGQFALALAAGMAATVNPCGFALLPAYLAMFLGQEGAAPDRSTAASVLRAFAVGLTMTVGFVAVFGLFGLVISPLAVSIERYLPWATIVIGIGLVALGAVLLTGRELTLKIPKLGRGGQDDGLVSMFVFGVSYAVASLSCTIGPFLAVTSATLSTANLASAVSVFVVYAIGMGVVVTALTVSVASGPPGSGDPAPPCVALHLAGLGRTAGDRRRLRRLVRMVRDPGPARRDDQRPDRRPCGRVPGLAAAHAGARRARDRGALGGRGARGARGVGSGSASSATSARRSVPRDAGVGIDGRPGDPAGPGDPMPDPATQQR